MLEPSTTTIPLTSRHSAVSWCACLVALALLAIVPGHAQAADESLRTVAVADPYLELHTGPGRGYPIFHVIDRGESVEITMQRTDWYQVRAENGVEESICPAVIRFPKKEPAKSPTKASVTMAAGLGNK